mmetsp:Transcript_33595/g.62970  ORF Transcript_33595/g.62970 Transcript_33595/m.62970 type:complete len:118 (+) Transcript_33595:44-397(+)
MAHSEGLALRIQDKLKDCFRIVGETSQVLTNGQISSEEQAVSARRLAKDYAAGIAAVRQELLDAVQASPEDPSEERLKEIAEEANACSALRLQLRSASERLRLAKELAALPGLGEAV